MSAVFKLKRFWIVFLILPAAAVTSIAAKYPSATERIYSTGIYPVVSGFFARIYGVLPFSLAEVIIAALPVLIITYIAVMLRRIARLPESRSLNAARLVSSLLCAAGAVCFGFTFLCGLNYHRESFTAASGLSVRPSSVQELADLCSELAGKLNTYAVRVDRDENNVMTSSFKNYYEAAAFAPSAYSSISGQYPVLGGYTPRAKPVLASRALSMAGLDGVYFPFTFEANVNIDVPAYEIPSAMLHELAHYKGFMREDEANFISYLACLASGSDDFAYSGLMLAFIHSSNALYSADRDAYWDLIENVDDGVIADWSANAAYWKQFEGPVSEFSEKVNDVYLKTNRQTAGVKSYGRMVDLLLAQYRKEHGIE